VITTWDAPALGYTDADPTCTSGTTESVADALDPAAADASKYTGLVTWADALDPAAADGCK
jgi:hypothetical protein